MKVKTSVTLSADLLGLIDARSAGNRSEWIESTLRAHLRLLSVDERAEREALDTRILNLMAAGTLGETSDVLDYSAPWWKLGDDFAEDDFADAPR